MPSLILSEYCTARVRVLGLVTTTVYAYYLGNKLFNVQTYGDTAVSYIHWRDVWLMPNLIPTAAVASFQVIVTIKLEVVKRNVPIHYGIFPEKDWYGIFWVYTNATIKDSKISNLTSLLNIITKDVLIYIIKFKNSHYC